MEKVCVAVVEEVSGVGKVYDALGRQCVLMVKELVSEKVFNLLYIYIYIYNISLHVDNNF